MLPPSVHVWASLTDTLPDFNLTLSKGGGAEPAGACLVGEACLDFLPLSVALASRAMPAGPLLRECQGVQSWALAQSTVARLRSALSKRRGDNGPSDTTLREAVGDAAAAIVQWRNGQELEGGEYGARGVAQRAAVRSIAFDALGESIDNWRREESNGVEDWDCLAGSTLPLPQLVGDASREDKAARLRFERTRAARPAKLTRRMDSLRAMGGRGRRVALLDKVQAAIAGLLRGESADQAALAAGFKAGGIGRGAVRPADRLTQALRRLGFKWRFQARESDGQESGFRLAFPPARWPLAFPPDQYAVFARKIAMRPATAAALAFSFRPSDYLPPSVAMPTYSKAARASNREQLRRRMWREQVRRALRTARRARQASANRARAAAVRARVVREQRQARKARELERWQARRLAKSGLWSGGPLSGNLPRYGESRRPLRDWVNTREWLVRWPSRHVSDVYV